MKRVFLGILLLGLLTMFANAAERRHSGSISFNDDTTSDDCAQHLRVYNDDYNTSLRDEEVRTVPNQPLSVGSERNGGIQVTTWDKPEFSIKLCKQVAADNESRARQLLADTKLEISSGRVRVVSPDRDNDDFSLGTLILVKAPRNATVDLTVENGGVSLNGFNGTATAHAENGGISLKKSSGKITAEAQNGGISIKDCSGDVSANVENGGVSLSLPQRWEGKGLVAHTQNGGLSVSVPRNFNSSLEISGSDHVPIMCRGEICNNAQRTWDESHRIFRLGTGTPTQIRATTVNGGIMISEEGHKRAEM